MPWDLFPTLSDGHQRNASHADGETYHVFCDESYLDHPYTVQGGIWIAETHLPLARNAFRELRERHPLAKEFKWEKVKGKEPSGWYRDVVDLFCKGRLSPFLSFKCLVTPRAKDPSRDGDKFVKQDGFYKAYHLLFRFRLVGGAKYHIRLDQRSGPKADAEAELAKRLGDTAKTVKPKPFEVLSCCGESSEKEDLIQLADVLCGAVGWAWNEKPSSSRAKQIIHDQIAKGVGLRTLRRETLAREKKFNIWPYDPEKRKKLEPPKLEPDLGL